MNFCSHNSKNHGYFFAQRGIGQPRLSSEDVLALTCIEALHKAVKKLCTNIRTTKSEANY